MRWQALWKTAHLPDGQISSCFSNLRKVHARRRKFYAFAVGQITGISSRVPRPNEGRIAIVTKRWRGMRWMRLMSGTLCRTKHEPHMAKPRGPEASTLVSTWHGAYTLRRGR